MTRHDRLFITNFHGTCSTQWTHGLWMFFYRYTSPFISCIMEPNSVLIFIKYSIYLNNMKKKIEVKHYNTSVCNQWSVICNMSSLNFFSHFSTFFGTFSHTLKQQTMKCAVKARQNHAFGTLFLIKAVLIVSFEQILHLALVFLQLTLGW